MWTEHFQRIDSNTLRLSLYENGQVASLEAVINGWQQQPGFRIFFSRVLASVPFEAFFWEMPAMLAATLTQPFECIFAGSPALGRATADPESFQAYFSAAHENIASFSNLGGDAILVVPVPLGADSAYPHIAAFARSAPQFQQDALWRQVGQLCREQLGKQPLWINTSGLGVCWTHIRLDTSPKYYSYLPYKRPGGK